MMGGILLPPSSIALLKTADAGAAVRSTLPRLGAVMGVTAVVTGAGLMRWVVSPRPRRPLSPGPQQWSRPASLTAQVWVSPALTCDQSVESPTRVGVATVNG